VIKNYLTNGVTSKSAVNFRWPRSTNAVIDDNEISYNAMAVAGSSGGQIRRNWIHNNKYYGITGDGVGLVVEGNEISYNRTDTKYSGGNSSATKFVWTDGLIMRNNWVHRNYGHGLWADINNINTVYEYNVIENNWWTGVFHEISYSAKIRYNYLRGNGFTGTVGGDYSGYAPWAIFVANSPDVDIHGNVLVENGAGIAGRQWKHPGDIPPGSPGYLNNHDWAYGDRHLKNMNVYSNDYLDEFCVVWSGGLRRGRRTSENRCLQCQ
jgi:hypothetical protein